MLGTRNKEECVCDHKFHTHAHTHAHTRTHTCTHTHTHTRTYTHTTVSRPTLSNLSCIRYEVEGETKEFSLLKLISDRWRQIGQLLSLKKDTLDKYHDERSSVERAKRVFAKWIKHNGHQDYPLTWVGLHMLLMKLSRRTVAERLYEVLYITGTDNNVDTLYLLQ